MVGVVLGGRDTSVSVRNPARCHLSFEKKKKLAERSIFRKSLDGARIVLADNTTTWRHRHPTRKRTKKREKKRKRGKKNDSFPPQMGGFGVPIRCALVGEL